METTNKDIEERHKHLIEKGYSVEYIKDAEDNGYLDELYDAHSCYANAEFMDGPNGYGEYCTECGRELSNSSSREVYNDY